MPLVLLLALAGCGKNERPNVWVDPALVTNIPAETTMLVGVRFDQLRKSPVYGRYFADRFDDQLNRFAQQTGLDPRKDLWELLACSNGKEMVLMGRGRFQASDLEPRLVKEGAAKQPYRGYTLFGDDRNAGFFLNSSTALVGSTPMLKRIIDGRDRKPQGLPSNLAPLVKSVPNGVQVWAAFQGAFVDLPPSDDGIMGNLNKIAKSVQTGLITVDLMRGVDLKVEGHCDSPEGAEKVETVLRGLLGIARLATKPEEKEILAAFDSIDIRHAGPQVKLSLRVGEDQVEKLAQSKLFQMGAR